VDSQNTSTIYAGGVDETGASIIIKSTDSGATWTDSSNGLPVNSSVSDIVIHPQQSEILYASTGAGIYKSTDGAQNWVSHNSGLPPFGILAIAIDPSQPSILYVAAGEQKIFKSTNGGEVWNPSSNGITESNIYISCLAIDPSNTSTIYASGFNGFYKSVDQGLSWTAANAGLPRYPGVGAPLRQIFAIGIGPTSADGLYVGIDNTGVYKSVDGGNDWTPSSLGLPVADVSALFVDVSSPSVVYSVVSFEAGSELISKVVYGGEREVAYS
jgi:photosystem II stability/assembly factor-like uncharacterized protein